MKTSKQLAGSIALCLSLAASGAAAADHALRHSLTTLVVAADGHGSKAPADSRREVEDLLNRARQAMRDGNYETADSLVTRAEGLKVDYNLFHLGDTPKKARKDLDAKKGAKKTQKPSEQFKPSTDSVSKQEGPSNGRITKDPFTARPDVTPPALDPAAENENLPALGKSQAPIEKSPFSRGAELTPPNDDEPNELLSEPGEIAKPAEVARSAAVGRGDSRRQSDALLLGARRALAGGDVRRATGMVEQAKQLEVEYGYHDDTPGKVEASIRKYQGVMEAAAGNPQTEGARHQHADVLMEQAQQLMRWKDYDEAERLAADASRLKASYGPFEAKPEALIQRIAAERKQVTGGAKTETASARKSGATGPAFEPIAPAKPLALAAPARPIAAPAAAAASAARPARHSDPTVVKAGGASAAPTGRYPTTQTVYDRDNDPTRNLIASSTEDEPAETVEPSEATPVDRLPPATTESAESSESTDALRLFQEGEQALRDRNAAKALGMFRQAYTLKDQLDPGTAQRLQDHLQLLSAPPAGGRTAPPKENLLDAAAAKQAVLARQVSAEVGKQQQAALKIKEKDPKKALELLKQARATVEGAGLEPAVRDQLLKRIDVSGREIDKHINEHKADIELDDANKSVKSEVDKRRHIKVDQQNRLAKLVDEYNTLLDEQRYPEAEVLAKRAREIDPDNPVSLQLLRQSQFIRRHQEQLSVEDAKEDYFVRSMESVDRSSVGIDDNIPYQFGHNEKDWKALTLNRQQREAKLRSRKSEKDLEIERKLKTPVMVSFQDVALSDVIDQLGKMAGVNVRLDPLGLAEEGVSSDTPVNINLSFEVSLKSALKLILEPLRLSYVVKDEVLKITSEQLRDGEVFTVTYSVADLVIPIPNFVPSSRIGLAGALAEAQANAVQQGVNGFGNSSPMAVLASQNGNPASAMINPAVLAQMNGNSAPQMGQGQPMLTGGPGGMGGGQQADFDSLIELITTTVHPTTWDEVGGPGAIHEFATNLSLVISQTQEVHEQIVDLLEQLRRLQDLQVTIEVRFITLNDNFFERIGVDFDFNIDDNVGVNPNNLDDGGPSITVGLQQPTGANPFPNFTADLDIPFRQDSFSLNTPQFGSPTDVAQFGFAILSDIEAYFLISAAQGDRRSNVLQAPKVTLFNGQQAFVSDTSQTPFVISVIPVVGDFAAAQQPVIVVLSEGTFLTVQAVISNDRRFVRLTVVPFFSQIGDVQTFRFTGSTTVTKNSSTDKNGDDTSSSDGQTTTADGVTVQLPTFSFVTVTTTVSVPDGGTVLLGGIKRLSEGRNEFGVPILSKLPYVNRLFKNVGIGRETQSLMMMVTPRIIIQEEEEERLGISKP